MSSKDTFGIKGTEKKSKKLRKRKSKKAKVSEEVKMKPELDLPTPPDDPSAKAKKDEVKPTSHTEEEIQAEETQVEEIQVEETQAEETQVGETQKAGASSNKHEFNPRNGLSYHDVVGAFLIFFKILWTIIKIPLYPYIWVGNEFFKMLQFWRASSHDEPMNKNEREFFESIPMLYILSGIAGGVALGIFAGIRFTEAVTNFFMQFDINTFQEIGKFIVAVIAAIVSGMTWLIDGVTTFLNSIISFVTDLFSTDPLVAFLILVVAAFVVVFIILLIREFNFLSKPYKLIVSIISYLFFSPRSLQAKIGRVYRSINRGITTFIVGRNRLNYRSQAFFKRVLQYTFLFSILIIASGIYVAYTRSATETSFSKTLLFFMLVLFTVGVISGLCIGLYARLLDFFSREKYIARSVIKEGEEKELLQQAEEKIEYDEDIDDDKTNDKNADGDEANGVPSTTT